MKILVVDNASMYKNNNKFYTNFLNGYFLNDLNNSEHELSYFQFSSTNPNRISGYDLLDNKVKCHSIKYYNNKIFNYIIAHLKILYLIHKYDFIYFYYPSSFKYMPIFCWIFNKKYGLYIRGMNGLKDRISMWNYSNAKIIFTVSSLFTKMITDNTSHKNVFTIKPMIQFSDRDIITDRTYSINSQKTKILFLGRITYDKGIRELLKALIILKNKHFNFELTIVGNGSYLEAAKQIIKDYNLINNIKIKGVLVDPTKIKSSYINADIFILPSYHEGFPRVLYEAMIFGTPIITTFVGGIPEIMKDGWNCKKIMPKSVESIVEGLEFAICHYDEMIKYAKNAFTTVKEIVDSKKPSHGQQLNNFLGRG